MTAKELKQKYLQFFEAHGHSVIPSASIVPENDPTVLFTTAGMQPLVPYLLGGKHPGGTRLVDVQKCIRTGDIDEVGDNTHLTFFEMLGNWSLGDYFKEDAIKWSFEFLTSSEWLNIPLESLAVTVFAGDEHAERDEESVALWLSLGISKDRIAYLGRDDNWWGPAGATGPCGPDTEIFYWTGTEPAPTLYDPADKRWVEIWNNVFMQFNKTADGTYEPLAKPNVDTGMGLERTTAVLCGKASVFEVEPLSTIVAQVLASANIITEEVTPDQLKAARIIADHLRAATFMLAAGVAPSNVERGYVLRRLIRRAVRYGKQLGINDPFVAVIAEVVIAQMGGAYSELREQRSVIEDELVKEEEKFAKALEKGLKHFEKLTKDKTLSGEDAFTLFSTYGFPFEMSLELAREQGIRVDEATYAAELAKHQDLSRTATAGKFKGGLADHSAETTRLHTATHLLLQSLRQIVSDQISQKGSNITAERLRFDFNYPDKLTAEQIAAVEALVNEQIQKALPVNFVEVSLDEAKALGATGVFEHKYGDMVKVYIMGENPEVAFSKEICGGPHVTNTSELGHFKIVKEEASSAGVRRIKAIVESGS
ncbi:MAG: alanine--tRNA ligase [Candidatus Buchananbacteria bacterium]|nr:alanine--tRNA ligase [Candidatus Buchananbacteria bacterium]